MLSIHYTRKRQLQQLMSPSSSSSDINCFLRRVLQEIPTHYDNSKHFICPHVHTYLESWIKIVEEYCSIYFRRCYDHCDHTDRSTSVAEYLFHRDYGTCDCERIHDLPAGRDLSGRAANGWEEKYLSCSITIHIDATYRCTIERTQFALVILYTSKIRTSYGWRLLPPDVMGLVGDWQHPI